MSSQCSYALINAVEETFNSDCRLLLDPLLYSECPLPCQMRKLSGDGRVSDDLVSVSVVLRFIAEESLVFRENKNFAVKEEDIL